MVYVIVIMAVAYWLGEGPAVLAFCLGLFAFAYFFMPPLGLSWPPTDSPRGWAKFAGFFLGTALVAFAVLLIRRSQRRTRQLAEQLRQSELHYRVLHDTVRRQLGLLQEALAPHIPSAESGCNTAAVYVPARAQEQIGGDFYDVFRTETGRVGAVIGDVAGKGIEAAALAAAARSTIHSFAYELSSPGAAMSHANTVLSAQDPNSGRFVSMFLAILDPADGALAYSRAGHPPAAVWRADGSVEFLEGGSPPVGVLARLEYATYETRLGVGEKLVLYTDGILEARRGNDFFETEGIERTLIESGQGTAAEVAEGLLSAAREWARGELRDDIAILVVECTGP